MKWLWVLSGVVLAAAALWLWRDDEPPPSPQETRIEMISDAEATVPVPVRAVLEFPEDAPAPVPKEAGRQLAEQGIGRAKETPAEWLNQAAFEQAGLTPEQAADLVEGLRSLLPWARLPPSDVEPRILVLFELSPRLSACLADRSIAFRWTPRIHAWRGGASVHFASDAPPESERRFTCTVHGRAGWLTLTVPREVCDQELWQKYVVVRHAPNRAK